MPPKITPLEKMLILAIFFNMALLTFRMTWYQNIYYIFYIWNTVLALLPFLFSRLLHKAKGINIRSISLLAGWLVFFPNAPYMITDLIHFNNQPPIPQWLDLLIVSSAAWNGLLLGIISLMQVEHFLVRHLKAPYVQLLIITSFILCGYGVYIGRYLRFNSWDAVTNPQILLLTIARHIFQPFSHLSAWAFSIGFGGMFGIIYYTLQHLHHHKKNVPHDEGRLSVS